MWEACPVAKQKAFDLFLLPLSYLSAVLSTQTAMRGLERVIDEYWSRVVCMNRLRSAMGVAACFVVLCYAEIAEGAGSAS